MEHLGKLPPKPAPDLARWMPMLEKTLSGIAQKADREEKNARLQGKVER